MVLGQGLQTSPYWSQPLQVICQLGPATYLLEDGSRWHTSRLRRVPSPQHTASVAPQAIALAWQESSEHQGAPAPTPDIPGAKGSISPTPDHNEAPLFVPS